MNTTKIINSYGALFLDQSSDSTSKLEYNLGIIENQNTNAARHFPINHPYLEFLVYHGEEHLLVNSISFR